jgi:uncharacterized DUF497 family protein
MQIEFDSTKDAQNRIKHGLSLAFAAELDWDEALVWIDARFAYDEQRMCALVPGADTLYHVAFVDRIIDDDEGDEEQDNIEVRRVISLRHATNREKRHYGQVFGAT